MMWNKNCSLQPSQPLPHTDFKAFSALMRAWHSLGSGGNWREGWGLWFFRLPGRLVMLGITQGTRGGRVREGWRGWNGAGRKENEWIKPHWYYGLQDSGPHTEPGQTAEERGILCDSQPSRPGQDGSCEQGLRKHVWAHAWDLPRDIRRPPDLSTAWASSSIPCRDQVSQVWWRPPSMDYWDRGEGLPHSQDHRQALDHWGCTAGGHPECEPHSRCHLVI